MPREKMNLIDRAKIFSPFDALKGFREMLEETGRVREERIILAEDYLEDLNRTWNNLEIGKIIRVKYYSNERYINKTGVLAKINTYHKRITICKDQISLKDIIEIEIIDDAF